MNKRLILPQKPAEPKKFHKTGENFDLDSGCSIFTILERINYNDISELKEITFDINSASSWDSASISIYDNREVENPNYDTQLEKYNKDIIKYKRDMEIYKKQLEEYTKENKDKEIEMARKILEKYNMAITPKE